jgi:hypothetical protein
MVTHTRGPLAGNGGGTFSPYRTLPIAAADATPPGPVAVEVAKLNHDHKHDIAVAHFTGNLVSVLLNDCSHK